MPNRLANESSPYLRQHQHNPVDWFPWGEEALQKAKTENKPIFLSIGYAACHWCHVMERESFEDEATAAVMNEYFVNVKVDREERPDLDGIYMQAVITLTRHGGWPMSVFLTPEGEPFYGGTYFPPTPRYQMPAFQQVLNAVADAWENDRENVRKQASQLSEHLQQELGATQNNQQEFDLPSLDEAAMKLAQAYDWKDGGWGKAPKFPQPMAIEFLLRKASRGDKMALQMAEHALDAMSKGGMYDVVGGGFARYSVDDIWLVPHFEKMLYDNAQLARVYLYGWILTKKSAYKRIAAETLDFIAREMTHSDGGFYSSLDADSEGVEGKFYVWAEDEIHAALPDTRLFELVRDAYDIRPEGNFEGKTVLQRRLSDEELAAKFDLASEQVPARLAEAHKILLEARSARIRPGTDDKCVAAWNGMMLLAYSEAAKYLKNSKYKSMAIRSADFILNHLRKKGSGRLLRTWRDGQPGPIGYLEDYAAVSIGLISLYQVDPNPKWFKAARELTDEMIALFLNPDGGFFDTGTDHEELIVRPRDVQDNATPSGSSLAVNLLFLMAAYTGNGQYRDLAEQALSPLSSLVSTYPTAFANWLCAIDLAAGPIHEVIFVSDRAEDAAPFEDALWRTYQPRVISARISTDLDPGHPEVAHHRGLLNEKPTVYVCEGFVCLQPVNSPEAFLEQLNP